MFTYVFIVLFTNGQEREIEIRAVSEKTAKSKVYDQLSVNDEVETIDCVEVSA